MPRDFKSFTNENSNANNNSNTKKYEDILNKYKSMNSNDLMQNLFTEASKLKSEGKLTNESLENLKSTLSPFLNSEQKVMLENLIEAINEQK